MILAYINVSKTQVLEEELKPDIKEEEPKEEVEVKKEEVKKEEVKKKEGGEKQIVEDAKGEKKEDGPQPASKGEVETKKSKKRENQEERSVHVKVGPGQMMIVKINTIDDDWGFVTSLFYKEEEIEEIKN